MPSLTKAAISLYLRAGCQRQLALNLYGDQERSEHGMPNAIRPNAKLTNIQQAGYEWQDRKANELRAVCGEDNVFYDKPTGSLRPKRINLSEVIDSIEPGQFIIEGYYDAAGETFKQALGMGQIRDHYGDHVDLSGVVPDIIQALPPMNASPQEQDDVSKPPGPTSIEVLHNATTEPLGGQNSRIRLRVIDVKLSSEPGPHYFAEVVLYSISLAAWLYDNGLSDKYAVVAAPAVWSSSYQYGKLEQLGQKHLEQGTTPTIQEVAEALDEELNVAEYDVFAARLKRLCSGELPNIASRRWDEVDWHVDYHCAHCEFLGRPDDGGSDNHQSGPSHCWNLAQESQSLCQVAGLTKASATLLRKSASTVRELAGIEQDNPVYNESTTLRAKRHVYPARAKALTTGEIGVIPGSGSDALIPSRPDLHIYLFLDYDLSTSFTGAFGVRAVWQGPRKTLDWSESANSDFPDFKDVVLAERRNVVDEEQALLTYLKTIRRIMDNVAGIDRDNGKPGSSSYQIYLWDEGQRRHLTRVLGRHLPAILKDPDIRGLA